VRFNRYSLADNRIVVAEEKQFENAVRKKSVFCVWSRNLELCRHIFAPSTRTTHSDDHSKHFREALALTPLESGFS